MIAALAGFVAALRRDGLTVSQAELLDAVRALELLGVADREAVRRGLRASLVKHHRDRRLFERRFAEFFRSPARAAGSRRARRQEAGAGAAAREGEGARGARRPRPEAEPARRARRLRRVVAREGDGRTSRAAESLSLERLPLDRELSADEERRLADAVPRLVERIRLQSGRRRRRASRGDVDLRRLFRVNAAAGGVPWVIPRRRPRLRRRRVVVLVDVSWSAARAAGLFLSLAAAFVERSRRTRVALFVDRPLDATAAVQRWLAGRAAATSWVAHPWGKRRPGRGIVRGGCSFADMLHTVDGLDLTAPSDYGRVFDSLPRALGTPRGRDAVLVVLGDGRTNRFDPQLWRFEELAAGFGAVLWLVPEPRRRWGTADSAVDRYLEHVDVAVEADDLEGLARGVAEWVRRL